jgi:plastocyanin
MPLPRLTLPALAALALVAAGCGSSDNGSGSTGSQSSGGGYGSAAPAKTASTAAKPAAAGGQTLKLDADKSGALKFTTDKLSAKAGKVTIQMTNPSGIPHSIAVEGNGVDKDSPQSSVTGGQTATVTATLKPGTYSFYCPVDGHEDAGMKGTLTVK